MQEKNKTDFLYNENEIGKKNTKRDTATIFNFSFIHFLVGLDRLSSSKLSLQSSSLPSSPSPAASSRPIVHVMNVNDTTLNTIESISQKNDDSDKDKTNNLEKQEQQESPSSNDTASKEVKLHENTEKSTSENPPTEQQNKMKQKSIKKTILSDDSKLRAQELLEKLSHEIENRLTEMNSSLIHQHKSFLGVENYLNEEISLQRSSVSSSDPYTAKRPPIGQRRSSTSNKNFNRDDNNMSNKTS